MNIFALSVCPIESAQQMIDKHVVKMPTESCQMLHTNALYHDYVEHYGESPTLAELKQFHTDIGSKLMKPAMLNHPSTIWARKSIDNTMWLYEHALALCSEYTFRYEKKHGTEERILQTPINRTGDYSKATPVDIAMDDVYRLPVPSKAGWNFVIKSYRHYYLEGKWRFAKWKKDRRPYWWPKNHYAVKYNEGVRAYNATNPKYPQTLLSED